MTDRWFSEEELAELSRPTMDRAVEAIDAGDLESARRLCGEMKHEWQMLHDLMAAGVLDLVSFIQQRLGEDAVGEAWEQSMNRGWRHHHAAIEALDRRDLVELLAATWRAHSCSGVGPNPGAFEISEDDEKVTFTMNPCGSGQRLVRNGAYDGLPDGGRTREAHDWSFDRREFPLYCTHCSFMNESLPIQWSGYPLYPCDPPGDYSKDPCTWYWYKDPDDIPERHYEPLRGRKAGPSGPGVAMSAGNVELVRSLHPPPGTDLAQNFRDESRWGAVAAAWAPVLAPDFRCAAHGYLEGDGETFEGLEGLRYLWLEWLSPWASYRTEIEDVLDVGDRALVLVRDFGTRTGEEHEVADSAAAIWTVREGKVTEITFYADRATAFRVVGLEP